MQSDETRIQYLFQRYFNKTATAQERDELARLISDGANKEQFMQLLGSSWQSYEGDGEVLSDESTDTILQAILVKKETVPVKKLWWPRIAAAAAVMMMVAGAAWFFIKDLRQPAPTVVVQQPMQDARPGSFKARLTLADGRDIVLDSAALGQLAKQGNTTIINKDGSIVYKPEGSAGAALYNTISTNKGETYSILLADGSRLWLNSASTVRFPVAFTGNERRVEITGEVYVKVAKDPAHPFVVTTNGMEVLALGTEFNVNAYSDEAAINTTLVEGSVQVSKQSARTLLKPGQQTQLKDDGTFSKPADVTIEEVVGWKDGYFHFESADLQTILRQFARWYNVEVVYNGPVPSRKFFVIVQRSKSLNYVLDMLKDNNVSYKLDGKKLIVGQ